MLTPRQRKFVSEYLIDRNATQAALRAGYSPRSAGQEGHRLLKNDEISTSIERRSVHIENKMEISRERVALEYARIAFLDPRSYYDDAGRLLSIKEMPEDAVRAIAGIEEEVRSERNADGEFEQVGVLKKIKLTSKTAALDGLARTLGMFQDTNVGMAAFQINIHVGRNDDES